MSKKHAIIMVACCLVGMGAVAAITLFRIPANNVLVGLMLLLCPLSHLLMMRRMNHGEHDPDHHHDNDKAQTPVSGMTRE